MRVEDETHALYFVDGPLEDTTFHLTGVVPFMQFQIGGDMDTPIFHLYFLDPDKTLDPTAEPVRYRFKRTYSFEEIVDLLR